MDRAELERRLDAITDGLADIEHKRWAHWQRYMHSQCKKQPDGSLVIPLELVQRWEKQIATPYRDLTEKEKDSDREQVRKYLPMIVQALLDN